MSNIVKKAIGVLKSPKKRTIILAQHGFFKNMSDEDFLKMQFKNVFGYPLDLENPKTYSEKLQWLKLYDRKPEYVAVLLAYILYGYFTYTYSKAATATFIYRYIIFIPIMLFALNVKDTVRLFQWSEKWILLIAGVFCLQYPFKIVADIYIRIPHAVVFLFGRSDI